TGRPWHALRTPLMTLVRLKGSVTPDRLTTMSEHVSTVVKRREQSGHWRRLRMDVPSSVVRLSTRRLSGCLQKGQCMKSQPSSQQTQWPRQATRAPRSDSSIGDLRGSEDPGDHNFWAAGAIQPLDVGIGSYIHAVHAFRLPPRRQHTCAPCRAPHTGERCGSAMEGPCDFWRCRGLPGGLVRLLKRSWRDSCDSWRERGPLPGGREA